jgi:threonine dehydratase
VNTFKVRNGTSALTALMARDPDAARRGVAAASTGNHGQGLAWAGARLGIPVTICVPAGNNPDKNASIRSYGARLIEDGPSYDAAVARCETVIAAEGLTRVHSTNDPDVIAGAGTMAAEFLEQVPMLDAIVLALGGGSQCVGAITVRDAQRPSMDVYAVQSEAASAQYDAWIDGVPRAGQPAPSFAEGIATGSTYELTFGALRDGLTDFQLVTEHALAQAVRDLFRVTHNVAEGAGAAGLAGVRALAPRLAGKTVGIVISGGNLDSVRLRAILDGVTP